jgi:hypothetical protein
MNNLPHSAGQRKAIELAEQLALFPQVAAVALGGSRSSGAHDPESDIDLYVYTEEEIPLVKRATIVDESGGSIRGDLNLPYWGGVNMWIDAASGITVDCMYFDSRWMEEEVARVLDAHHPSLGYSTCFCRTVQQSIVLYDPRGWFQALQARSKHEYPGALRRNIIAHNHPVLRTIISSYLYQIQNAVRRNDIVSINHRVAALLASYFDIVFALNRVLHPGEKRLLALAHKECPLLPRAMDDDVAAVVTATAAGKGDLIRHLNTLLDRLDELLTNADAFPKS